MAYWTNSNDTESGSNLGLDKGLDAQHEHFNTHQRPQGNRTKRHCARWWLIYLILLLVIGLGIVLGLIFGVFPKIAQDGVDNSILGVTSMSILNPSPTSFHLIQDAFSESNSTFHPQLDAFNASLALAGNNAFGQITLPAFISGTDVPAHINQEVQITDMDAFIAYNKALLGDEQVSVQVTGNTWLREGALPATNVNFDKTVVLKGLNSLRSFSISNITLLSKPLPSGQNLLATVHIPNPSILTIALGNLTFANSVDGTSIGNSTLRDLTLVPGNNTVPMQAWANQTAIFGLVQGKYSDGKLPVDIVTQSVVYNGQNLGYYEQAMKGVSVNTVLDLSSIR